MQRIGVSVSSPLPLSSSLSLSSFLFFPPPLTRAHPLARRAARLKTPTRIESRGVEWGASKADLGMARARSLGGLAMRRSLLRASCPLPEPPSSRRWPFPDASALPRFFWGEKKQDSSSCAAAPAREERHAEAQNAAPQLAQCAGRAQTRRRSAASLGAGRGEKKREKKGAARLGRLDRAFGHPARAPNERASIGPSGCVAAEATQMA